MNKKNLYSTFNKPDYLIFGLLIVFPLISVFFNIWLALSELAAGVAYIVYRVLSRKKHSEQLYSYLQSITLYLDEASKESLTRFPMPVTLLSSKGDIIWYNDLFHEMLSDNKIPEIFGRNFDIIAPQITIGQDSISQKHDITFLGRHYSIFVMRQGGGSKDDFYCVYWIDITDTRNELVKLRSSRLCMAYLLVDSYDELPSSVTELQKSTFITRVDVKVRAFIKSVDGILQKLDSDKYLVIFEQKYLQSLEKNKFKILSDVREISVDGFHATLSLGVGCGTDSVKDTDIAARTALDVALSRGGDQAVVLNKDKYSFYGGNSDGAQKRKRVKVRIIAEALMAHVQNSDNVIIMGHKFADLDCVGSAIGIAKCVQSFGKQPYIIYNPRENLSKTMYASFMKLPGYENVFVDVLQAPRFITENSLLIITDTHNIEYVESEKLFYEFKRVVIIDHHRKTVQNAIEGAVINFHEPNASSCCEMVSELCESVPHLRLSRQEANALMSGIFLDTKTFTERTGARTFEAAAYLKKQGADTAEVKEFFKSDIESYKKQIDIIADAHVINEKYAVSVWKDAPFDGIKLIASKAADEMLNLNNIESSYVIYPEGGDAHISARSDQHGNVQRIMERLGGGGHRAAAGAQLKDTGVNAAYDMLIDILNNPESEEK